MRRHRHFAATSRSDAMSRPAGGLSAAKQHCLFTMFLLFSLTRRAVVVRRRGFLVLFCSMLLVYARAQRTTGLPRGCIRTAGRPPSLKTRRITCQAPAKRHISYRGARTAGRMPASGKSAAACASSPALCRACSRLPPAPACLLLPSHANSRRRRERERKKKEKKILTTTLSLLTCRFAHAVSFHLPLLFRAFVCRMTRHDSST